MIKLFTDIIGILCRATFSSVQNYYLKFVIKMFSVSYQFCDCFTRQQYIYEPCVTIREVYLHQNCTMCAVCYDYILPYICQTCAVPLIVSLLYCIVSRVHVYHTVVNIFIDNNLCPNLMDMKIHNIHISLGMRHTLMKVNFQVLTRS